MEDFKKQVKFNASLLKQLLREKDLTQIDLGKRLKLDPNTVSRFIRKGHTFPYHLDNVEDYLGVKKGTLTDGVTRDTDRNLVPSQGLDGFATRLLSLLEKCQEEKALLIAENEKLKAELVRFQK